MNYKIVLASKSGVRKKILNANNIKCEVIIAHVDEDQVKVMEKKLRQATFDLDDFLQQIQNVKKMGSLSQIMDMLPGMGQMGKQMPGNLDDSQMKKIEAIIQSMTSEERHHPELINGSRRRRIATGSGTTAQDINLLLNQFKQTQKIMRLMKIIM